MWVVIEAATGGGSFCVAGTSRGQFCVADVFCGRCFSLPVLCVAGFAARPVARALPARASRLAEIR